MNAAFDTLRLTRTLRDKARFSPDQAEGLADAIAEAMQGYLATKTDLSSTQGILKAEIQDIRAYLRQTARRLEAKIEATKADLVKWVVGMIGLQTVVLLGAALALAPARWPGTGSAERTAHDRRRPCAPGGWMAGPWRRSSAT